MLMSYIESCANCHNSQIPIKAVMHNMPSTLVPLKCSSTLKESPLVLIFLISTVVIAHFNSIDLVLIQIIKEADPQILISIHFNIRQ